MNDKLRQAMINAFLDAQHPEGHSADELADIAIKTFASLPSAQPQEPDINKCPACGGVADNGHDRCYPPNPYYCTKCTSAQPSDVVERAVKLIDEAIKHCPKETAKQEGFFTRWLPHPSVALLNDAKAALTTQQAQSVQKLVEALERIRDTDYKQGISMKVIANEALAPFTANKE